METAPGPPVPIQIMARRICLQLTLVMYPHRASYLGSDSDDIWSLHSPGFSEDAAKWLVAERKIK